jgi:hypothetical protein
MTRRLLAAFLVCFIAACQQPEKVAAPVAPAPADPRQLTEAEKRVITDEIIANWDLEVMKGCPWGEMAPVELQLTLASDASVTGIARAGMVEDSACGRRAYDSAEAAVRAASPLAVPDGKIFRSMRLRLKPLHAVW